MKIYILRKSITDLKNPIIKNEYITKSVTVKDLITEMVIKNYEKYLLANNALKKIDDLNTNIKYALEEFVDGSFYIINNSKNHKYNNLSDLLDIEENDEIILIKLKYVRGIIWML